MFSISAFLGKKGECLCLVSEFEPCHGRRTSWYESLIDNVLSVSGTDYHDIGALGGTKSSKNIAQSWIVGSVLGRTKKKVALG